MTETKSVKTLKKQLGAAIAMVLVAAVALGSSTYAWFVTNTKVTAGKAEMTATAANTLLISAANANEWATSYDFTDKNVSFAPVSTIGTGSIRHRKHHGHRNEKPDTLQTAPLPRQRQKGLPA